MHGLNAVTDPWDLLLDVTRNGIPDVLDAMAHGAIRVSNTKFDIVEQDLTSTETIAPPISNNLRHVVDLPMASVFS